MASDAELPSRKTRAPESSSAFSNPHDVQLPSAAERALASEPLTPEGGHATGAGAVGVVDGASSATPERRERISQTTAQGGFRDLPTGFDDRDGDWQCVLSTDPFEVLFLDRQQYGVITGELLRRHFRLLDGFWSKRIQMMEHGNAKAQLLQKFGGDGASEKVVRSHPQKVRAAYEELSAVGGIQMAFDRLERRRREAGERRLADFVRQALVDGMLDPMETEALVDEGRRAGLRDEEIDAYVSGALRERKFEPMGDVAGYMGIERLLAVEWMTPARIVRERHRHAPPATESTVKESAVAPTPPAAAPMALSDVLPQIAQVSITAPARPAAPSPTPSQTPPSEVPYSVPTIEEPEPQEVPIPPPPRRRFRSVIGAMIVGAVLLFWFNRLDARVDRAISRGAIDDAARLVHKAGGPDHLAPETRLKLGNAAEGWLNDALNQWMRASRPPASGWEAAATVALVLHDISSTTGNHTEKVNYLRGQIAFENKRWQEARSAFQLAATGSEPNLRALAFNGLGRACWHNRAVECSVQSYRSAMLAAPNWIFPIQNLGAVALNNGQFTEAEALFTRAVRLDPSRAFARYGLGEAYMGQHRYAEARAQYQEALRLPGLDAGEKREVQQRLVLVNKRIKR